MIAKKIISGAALVFQMALYSVSANPRPGLKFVANQSQWASEVNFSVKIQGGNLRIGSGSFTYSFLDQQKLEELHDHHQSSEVVPNHLINGQIIKSSFLGSNKNIIPQPFGIQPEYYNYFLGTDTTSACDTVHVGLIENKEETTPKVFPNPTDGKFTLWFNVHDKLGFVEVYDVNGKLVLKENVAQWSQYKHVDISHQQSGIYFIKMQWQEKTTGVKVIKQ